MNLISPEKLSGDDDDEADEDEDDDVLPVDAVHAVVDEDLVAEQRLHKVQYERHLLGPTRCE